MFDITAKSLVSIKDFSPLEEDEFILLPGTILEVKPPNVTDAVISDVDHYPVGY